MSRFSYAKYATREQFLCMFEVVPGYEWALGESTRLGTLSLLQLKLLEKRLVINRIAAFSQHPGMVSVCRRGEGGTSYEAMGYSLKLLALRWPDAFQCSTAEIGPNELSLRVEYENGVKPELDEHVLVVLGGSILQEVK